MQPVSGTTLPLQSRLNDGAQLLNMDVLQALRSLEGQADI